MNKTFQVIFGIVVIVLLAVVAFELKEEKKGVINLGGGVESYSDATNSSSSIPQTATTTSPILSLDTYRTDATICYLSGTSTVWLHPKGQSTTTGVVKNEGIPLASSTTSNTPYCREFPGFVGYLFGISAAPVVVSVSEHR